MEQGGFTRFLENVLLFDSKFNPNFSRSKLDVNNTVGELKKTEEAFYHSMHEVRLLAVYLMHTLV